MYFHSGDAQIQFLSFYLNLFASRKNLKYKFDKKKISPCVQHEFFDIKNIFIQIRMLVFINGKNASKIKK